LLYNNDKYILYNLPFIFWKCHRDDGRHFLSQTLFYSLYFRTIFYHTVCIYIGTNIVWDLRGGAKAKVYIGHLFIDTNYKVVYVWHTHFWRAIQSLVGLAPPPLLVWAYIAVYHYSKDIYTGDFFIIVLCFLVHRYFEVSAHRFYTYFLNNPTKRICIRYNRHRIWVRDVTRRCSSAKYRKTTIF